MTFSSSRLAIFSFMAALAVTAAASPAEAQNRRAIPRAQADRQAREAQTHFDNGVREGLREGQTDARRRDRFDFSDERAWQRGNAPYRQGFETGYRRGFAGVSGGYGGGVLRGNDPYGRGNSGYGRGNGRIGSGIYANPAMAAGFNDGFEQGFEDARDGDRFDPLRSKDYRDADNDYDRRFGTKAQWQVAYRDGFRAGYEQGYEEARRYGYRR